MRPETETRVAAFVADLRARPVHRQVRAVVLCGSAARGEERWDGGALAGDIDLMVVTRTRSPRVGAAVAAVVQRHLAAGIEGGQMPLVNLRRYRTLIACEARMTGIVVDGDRAVLEQIPVSGPEQLGPWEPIRLLLNRLFEHLRLRAGETTEPACVVKSYEALGEARLLAEGRYRPSFAGRLAEVSARPLGGPVAGLQERYLATHAVRNGTAQRVPADPARAQADLLRALDELLPAYTGRPGDVLAQLDHVGRRERNVAQRLFWTAHEAAAGRPRLRHLREDPSVGVWRAGLELALGRSDADPGPIVAAWQRCPQILAPRAGPA